eukprot:g20275.t1
MHTANATEHVSVKMPTTSDVRHMVLLSSEPGHRPVQATAESLLEEETEATSDVDEDDEEDLAMDAEDTEVGQSWTSERRRRNRRRRRSRRRRRTTTTTTTTTSTLPNTYVGFQINDGLLYVVTKNTQQQIQAPSGMSSVATVEAKVVGSSVVVFLDGSEVASIAKPTTGPLYGALWSSRGAAVELPDVFDEVLVSPVSQQCSNPLDEREAAKSKAEEETNPEDFLFDDPNVPLGVENLYSLSPCECFSGDFGNAPPVDDGSFATMPPGSDNSYLPASLLIVSGSLGVNRSMGASCDRGRVNSHGELYGVSRQESCLLSSPELCRAKKREKPTASDSLLEHLKASQQEIWSCLMGWGCGGFSTSVWAHCPEEVSCPSGSTMVACQAVPSFSPYGHTPLGAVVTSSGTCKAWGNYAMGAKALGGTEVTGPETTSDQWSEWATCPSGSVAVTVRRLIAGVDIDGTKGDWNLKYFSNSKDWRWRDFCETNN